MRAVPPSLPISRLLRGLRSPRVRRRLLATAGALAALVAGPGCSTVPTPLHPGAHGSIGYPHNGVLRDPVLLPAKGEGYVWLRPEGRHYGTQEMVSFLDHSTQRAKISPDVLPFRIGDIAQKTGGKVSGHHSHRTGRDVDILFAYTTPGGAPVDSPGFVKVHADGLAYVPSARGLTFLRFDVPRNWALVKAMLQSPDAQVQWIFVYRPVESLLIEYARALGEPNELVWRAENVMHQPGDSLPHDDHFHVRIACTDNDLGCLGGGPRWPWTEESPTFTETELVAMLLTGDVETPPLPAALTKLGPKKAPTEHAPTAAATRAVDSAPPTDGAADHEPTEAADGP
jgi:penicillin-insensitive murein DD-endopeptidase